MTIALFILSIRTNAQFSVQIIQTDTSCLGEACTGALASAITGGISPYSILWSDFSTGTTLTGLCPNVSYFVIVTDAASNTVSDTTLVISKPFGTCDDTIITFPIMPVEGFYNAFSPNGDGYNEYWHITHLNINDNEVQIFNRWGRIIFQTINYNNLDNVWRGTYKGQPVAVGTYFYFIINENKTPLIGWVEVTK